MMGGRNGVRLILAGNLNHSGNGTIVVIENVTNHIGDLSPHSPTERSTHWLMMIIPMSSLLDNLTKASSTSFTFVSIRVSIIGEKGTLIDHEVVRSIFGRVLTNSGKQHSRHSILQRYTQPSTQYLVSNHSNQLFVIHFNRHCKKSKWSVI